MCDKIQVCKTDSSGTLNQILAHCQIESTGSFKVGMSGKLHHIVL